TDGNAVGDGLTETVEVAAQEEDSVVAGAAEEAVALCRDQRLLSPLDEWQWPGNELEDVVAALAEDQVAGLAVEPTREHVVVGPAEDELLARAAGQDVASRAAQDDVAAQDADRAGQVTDRKIGELHRRGAALPDGRRNLVPGGLRSQHVEEVLSGGQACEADRAGGVRIQPRSVGLDELEREVGQRGWRNGRELNLVAGRTCRGQGESEPVAVPGGVERRAGDPRDLVDPAEVECGRLRIVALGEIGRPPQRARQLIAARVL